MNTVEQLQQERTRLVQKMLNISCARKGSVTEQYFPVMKNGTPTDEKRGPYWIFSTKRGGQDRQQASDDVNRSRPCPKGNFQS